MLDYRTWGQTKNCKGCRYWSERVAQSIGCGPIEALCLNYESSPYKGKYTTGTQTCDGWKEGSLGAVDDPAGNPYGADDA